MYVKAPKDTILYRLTTLEVKYLELVDGLKIALEMKYSITLTGDSVLRNITQL